MDVPVRLLTGLRQAVLETLADLQFAGSPAVEAVARSLLAWLDDARRDLPGDIGSRSYGAEGTHLEFELRHETARLSMSADVLRVTYRALIHARESMRAFEASIHLRILREELDDLIRELESSVCEGTSGQMS
jgi:hypothetical protein